MQDETIFYNNNISSKEPGVDGIYLTKLIPETKFYIQAQCEECFVPFIIIVLPKLNASVPSFVDDFPAKLCKKSYHIFFMIGLIQIFFNY